MKNVSILSKNKIIVVFIIILVFLFSIIAYADNYQWVYVNNNWYALDGINQLVCNKWIVYKNEEYHLSLDGKMDTNKWIDGIYYVDTNGKKLRNTFTPDGYYVNLYGVYDASIPRYSNITNQYQNMPIATEDVNITNSLVIDSTKNTNSAITPPINNYYNLPNTNIPIINENKNNGFYLTIVGYNEDNNYYGRHDRRSQYKTINVRLTYDYQNNYLLNNTKLDLINDSLETICDDFENDAIEALEHDYIKKYYINKSELTKISHSNIVITFSGYMIDYDNNKSNIKYRFTYYIYDEYYTMESIG